MKVFLTATLIAASLSPMAVAQDAKIDARIDAAHAVLHELMNTPDRGVPLDVASKATCVLVVPSFKKAAFVFGAEYGQGVVTCRTRSGRWSAPAFVQLEGASFGFQVGGQSTDLVLIGMNHHAVDDLLKDKVKLGADASVAGGPVGRTSSAETDAQLHAEILTWSRSRGAFAGISLQGATLRPDEDWNRELYNAPLTNKEIVMGNTPAPPAAGRLLDVLNKYSSRK